MYRPQRLYTRLVLAVSMVTAVGVISLSLWTSMEQSASLQENRLHEALVMVDNFAQSTANNLVVEDYARLEEFLKRAVLLSKVRRITAIDPQGKVLSAVRRGSDRTAELIIDAPPVTPPDKDTPLYTMGSKELILWKPIEAGNLLGWLQVTYTLEDIAQMKAQVWQHGVIVGVVWLCGTCLLVMLVLHPGINAIRQLASFARDLPLRKGSTTPVNRSVLELSELGEALNHASTELNRIEQELLEMNRTLEVRVEEELAKSRQKDALLLQQARFQTMGELLVNIAHHWRQPLNNIGARVQENAWLLSQGELPLESAMPAADQILQELKQLSRSIEGFQLLCRPAGPDELLLPSEAAKRVILMVRDNYQQQGICIELKLLSEAMIHGSLQDLAQCLLNLFSNARDAILEQGAGAGQISVSIELLSPESVSITVSDTGRGIPANLLDSLFDPYVTSKFRSQGVGLGLFVVRQIVEQHFNGSVAACNGEHGAAVTIEIPTRT